MIADEKKELRKFYSALRERLHCKERDAAVREQVFSRLDGDSFFVYCSIKSEVDTRGIIDDLLKADKLVCLPRIEGANMVASSYFGGSLHKGMYGIPAPESGADTPCEVALVPLLAVDEAGYRLGYGGGYYDRYFALHPGMKRVGLCYEEQVVKKLPHEIHDFPLHAVITENGYRLLKT